MELDKTDQQIIETIKYFNKEYGYSPTYSELVERTKYSSTSGVKKRIKKLIDTGFLKASSFKARSLQVIE